jgi:hypothetical protein
MGNDSGEASLTPNPNLSLPISSPPIPDSQESNPTEAKVEKGTGRVSNVPNVPQIPQRCQVHGSEI